MSSVKLNAEQQRVFEWMNNELQLCVFAEAYKGAVVLLKTKSPGYISLVSHVGRDLMNSLARTATNIRSERVQYQNHLDAIQLIWKDEWRFDKECKAEEAIEGHLIPTSVCQKVLELINAHKKGRIRNSEADIMFFTTFIDYEQKDRIPANFLIEWKKAKKWFQMHAHLRKPIFKPDTDGKLEEHFKCLHGYLYIAASSQYERLKEINEILDSTNA